MAASSTACTIKTMFKHKGLFEVDNAQQKPTVFTRIELVGVKPKE